jgi:type 1 glutamine amidotransferase
MRTTSITIASLLALTVAACGQSRSTAEDLDTGGTGAIAGTDATGGIAGTGAVATGGTGAIATGGTGAIATGGTGAVATGGTGAIATGGTGGDGPMGGAAGTPVGGSAGSGMETGGMGGSGMMGGAGGSGGVAPPYAPRTGSFKMLVYSQVCCSGFPHDSRVAGRSMLQDIGQKQGFEVIVATDDSEINPTGLAQYELVFFLNSTGDLWASGNLRRDFEAWIRNNGAYAGMHGATDSASSWAFYKELTGQYYDQHDAVISGTIQWTDAGLTHVAGRRDLPNPWNRREEWYKFNSWSNWSTKPGFTVLNTVTTTGGGTRPVSYLREWENIRAFYTSLGHEDAPYTDETVIKHVTAGIMWAVRREHLL